MTRLIFALIGYNVMYNILRLIVSRSILCQCIALEYGNKMHNLANTSIDMSHQTEGILFDVDVNTWQKAHLTGEPALRPCIDPTML